MTKDKLLIDLLRKSKITVLLGRGNCHLYHYAGNNPIKFTDPDGRNVAVEVTTENLVVGHTRLFFQDENAKWYRFDQGWNGTSDFASSLGLEDSGKANVIGLLIGSDAPSKVSITPVDAPSENATLIQTTLEQDKMITKAAKESLIAHNENGKKYNLYTNNCTDSVVNVLKAGEINLYNPETNPKDAFLRTAYAFGLNSMLGCCIGSIELMKLVNTMPIFWQKNALPQKK